MTKSMGTILVVDDEAIFAKALAEILEWDGFEVTWAYSASMARALLKDVSPDLFLIDVVMPEESGLALIRHLRSQLTWKKAPMIVISAKAMSRDRTAALLAGADAFLPKPFSHQELLTAIRPFLPLPAPIHSLPADLGSIA